MTIEPGETGAHYSVVKKPNGCEVVCRAHTVAQFLKPVEAEALAKALNERTAQ